MENVSQLLLEKNHLKYYFWSTGTAKTFFQCYFLQLGPVFDILQNFFTRLLFSHRSLNRKSTTVSSSLLCISYSLSGIFLRNAFPSRKKSVICGWWRPLGKAVVFTCLICIACTVWVSIKQFGLQMTQNFNKNGHLFLCLSSHISNNRQGTKTGVIFKFCYD